MIRLAVVGAAGRTGRLVVEVVPEFPHVKLTAAAVSPTSPLVGQSVPHAGSLTFSSNIASAVDAADVVVDFSRPNVSIAVAEACADAGKPCLIATTGHAQGETEAIAQAAKSVAVLVAPNTSAGVFVTIEMARLAAKLLGETVDIEVVELHHGGKRDQPSGTAKALAAAAGASRALNAVSRTAERQSHELGVASLRGGDVVGEHTVYFLGRGERIELTHRATDRAIFARGAIRLAVRLIGMAPGLKRLSDLYNTP